MQPSLRTFQTAHDSNRVSQMKSFKRAVLSVMLMTGPILVVAQGPPPPAADYFPGTWNEMTSAEGAFRVRFPGTPNESTKEYAWDNLNLTLHSLTYGSPAFIAYSVDYRDYPEVLTAGQTKKLFERVRENRLEGPEGKMVLLRNSDDQREGYPALFLELEFMGQKRIRELDIVNGRRHYTILVVSFSNHGSNTMGSKNAYAEIANAFLDSFHIIQPTRAQAVVH